MTEHVTVCDQAYDPSTTPKYDLHSVSSLTTYQLRQELVRLGAFERFFPPERVQYCCYDSLLEAHITLLREAKAEEEAAAFAKHNAEVEARKAQLATQRYKAAGGGYRGSKSSSNSLSKWTRQDWGTKSGKNSTQGPKATGERYLPKKARDNLSKKEYAATSRKKRADTKKGKQFSSQPKKIANKTKSARS